MKRKSNIRWWLFGLMVISSLYYYENVPEFVGDIFFGGALWFLIGLGIDKFREHRWNKTIQKSQQDIEISGQVVEVDGKYYKVKKIEKEEKKE